MALNINNFCSTIKDWNVKSFGHIGYRKKVLLARLKHIEAKLNFHPSYFLRNLEKELRDELEEMLNQEESLWKQKARCKWAVEGDCNTKFYHASATVKRRTNTISMLKLNDDSWCDDYDVLKELAIECYSSLFTKDGLLNKDPNTQGLFYKFSNE